MSKLLARHTTTIVIATVTAALTRARSMKSSPSGCRCGMPTDNPSTCRSTSAFSIPSL